MCIKVWKPCILTAVLYTYTDTRFKGRCCHVEWLLFFFFSGSVGQVMDPLCPGRESVCLSMMKSSTCPHLSTPLHILIITNLQTYSKGHTVLPPTPTLNSTIQLHTQLSQRTTISQIKSFQIISISQSETRALWL